MFCRNCEDAIQAKKSLPKKKGCQVYKYESRDMEREALFRRFDNGGVFRFYKRPDKVPTPIRIDIENPADFSYDTPPIARQGNMVLSQGMLISDIL